MTMITAQPAGSNPILASPNRLKLGIFGINISSGLALTLAEDRHRVTWPKMIEISQLCDEYGFEANVPVARWRGYGGLSDPQATNFETYTWAAGVAQATRRCAVLTTSHVPVTHPIVAAKQAATVDHISNGRFALNIVCGWFQPELEMFGVPIREHDSRYDYAEEWIEIVKRLWSTEEEFDYEGRFFRISKGFSMPKPVQRPFPPLMNAGGSGRGRDFAAKHADMAFILPTSFDKHELTAQVESYRRLAREEYHRELQIWTYAYVVHGDTREEAEKFRHYYAVERGDDPCVANVIRVMGIQAQTLPPAITDDLKFHFKAGFAGIPLVGTADYIVDRLQQIAGIGFDGVLLGWLDYAEGLRRWNKEIAPRMVQAGLRQPVR
jgi:alkanesulfonate monooxygenase SsuD/methylene tetrahydromethanopterin reductase-like flavin-dependent oxidoreductase (luciferase family)